MNKSRHRGIKERNNSEQSGDIHALYEEYARIFITEKQTTFEKGNPRRKGLNQFIHGLLHSGRETGKIAKSIDEIARRANLIALMAAVEAQRAGKEGTACAAMAKEARDLAIMSAETVSNTRRHIEYAVTALENIHDISQLKMASLHEKQGVA